MIPSEEQIKALWDTYAFPALKRKHSLLVAKVARLFGERITQKTGVVINVPLLVAAAMLHDIDKAIVKLPGERHPDAAVRILKEKGMDEIARVVGTHSLHAILDPATKPRTWEQKILYLADKMVKYDIVGTERRFALWRAERLPPEATDILNRSYPKVKTLEKELLSLAGLSAHDVATLALQS